MMDLFLLPLSGVAGVSWLPVWAYGVEEAVTCAAVLLALQYGLVKPGGKL